MTPSFRRRSATCLLMLAVAAGASTCWEAAYGASAQAPPITSIDQLETQAGQAILQSDFSRTSSLLNEAASESNNPQVATMARWATDFESQQQHFASERQKQFDKNVADIHKLLDHNLPDYAIDAAAQAYLRATNKTEFRNEPWINQLVQQAANDAGQAEQQGRWPTAQLIYADLSSLDPSSPAWKDKLKQTTRRLRLVGLYTPDQFRKLQETEVAARKTADELLRGPTTQPTTAPAEADADGDFKIDWRETVKGITFDMLFDGLVYAEHDYYRDAPFAKLMNGGYAGLETLATTPGLSSAFPGLADPVKVKKFQDALHDGLNSVGTITGDDAESILHMKLQALVDANDNSIKLPEEVLVSEFADGAFAELDPFTSMIWPYELEEFNKTTQGEFSGVGIQIDSDPDGSLRVVTPLEDSPAYRAGIQANDVITYIDGKNAKGITTNQAVKTITGPVHTPVTLTIRSTDGSVKNYTLMRETINVASIEGFFRRTGGGWDYLVDPDNKIAYIRLTNFTKKSGAELVDALSDLEKQHVRGIILDLRYNPGGLLVSAIDVASQFIRRGTVVSTHPDRETENRPTVNIARPDDQTTDVPLAVLVNQYSASASEIVSGALKDDHRATIVGERTFGKGSVQMLFPLTDKTAFLKLTTSHYYLPSGRCLHREENSTDWGVDPDVAIEMTPEQMRGAIEARRQLGILRNTPTTQPVDSRKALLASDPQLSAALLVLRLELAGVQI